MSEFSPAPADAPKMALKISVDPGSVAAVVAAPSVGAEVDVAGADGADGADGATTAFAAGLAVGLDPDAAASVDKVGAVGVCFALVLAGDLPLGLDARAAVGAEVGAVLDVSSTSIDVPPTSKSSKRLMPSSMACPIFSKSCGV